MKLDTANLCGARGNRGLNMCTASGLPFWPSSPRIEDIRIEDIAAHLSRICRFNGALRDSVEIYSVAQHCYLMSKNVPEDYALEALLHDAPEYIVGDRVKPIKVMTDGSALEQYEDDLDRLIRRKYGLPRFMTAVVKAADYRSVLTERRDVLHPDVAKHVDWGTPTAEPWPDIIEPWLPSRARTLFLRRFKELYYGNV